MVTFWRGRCSSLSFLKRVGAVVNVSSWLWITRLVFFVYAMMCIWFFLFWFANVWLGVFRWALLPALGYEFTLCGCLDQSLHVCGFFYYLYVYLHLSHLCLRIPVGFSLFKLYATTGPGLVWVAKSLFFPETGGRCQDPGSLRVSTHVRGEQTLYTCLWRNTGRTGHRKWAIQMTRKDEEELGMY